MHRSYSRHESLVIRLVLLIAVAVAGVGAFAGRAEAHPLGNFTINRHAVIQPSAGVVRITYVLDQAELPTFQEQDAIDADKDGFALARVEKIRSNLRLTVNGQARSLEAKAHLLTEPPGQGGLRTLRLTITFEAAVEGTPTDLQQAEFVDSNEPDRVGWREIVVAAAGNAVVVNSNVSANDSSDALQRYPSNLLQAPLNVRSATFRFSQGDVRVAAAPLAVAAASGKKTNDGFADLISRHHVGALGVLTMILIAFGFGAVHALSPGHGKSVMAAYLVGTKGRPVDAVLLGVIVAVMHTGSVLLVGVALLTLASETDISKLYPVLTLLSGLVVLTLGLYLVVKRTGVLQRKRGSSHGHDHHDHEHHDHEHHDHEHHDHEHHDHEHHDHEHHDHEHHDHEHHDQPVSALVHDHGFGSHSHELPADVAPLSRKGLVLLATTGGLLPSPSAVVVLISAVSLDRLALGLSLIAVFSIGLAVTLTAVGLGLVYGRAFAERSPRSNTLLKVLPVLSAVALIVVGCVAVYRGATGL